MNLNLFQCQYLIKFNFFSNSKTLIRRLFQNHTNSVFVCNHHNLLQNHLLNLLLFLNSSYFSLFRLRTTVTCWLRLCFLFCVAVGGTKQKIQLQSNKMLCAFIYLSSCFCSLIYVLLSNFFNAFIKSFSLSICN